MGKGAGSSWHRPTQPSRRPRPGSSSAKMPWQPAFQLSRRCSSQIDPQRMLPSPGLSVTGRNPGKLGQVRPKTSAFWSSKSHSEVLKCNDFPYLSQWTSQRPFPPRARPLCLRLPSEGNLEREEHGQAQELSLKNREMGRSLGPVTKCEICQHFILIIFIS